MHTQVCTFIGSLPTASLLGAHLSVTCLLQEAFLTHPGPPYSCSETYLLIPRLLFFGITLNFQASGFFGMSTCPHSPPLNASSQRT